MYGTEKLTPNDASESQGLYLGNNIHLEKSVTFLRMKSLVWKVALWKQRVNKNERKKAKNEGGKKLILAYTE